MNADQREAVRENAKYLRNVRPLDPDEISEYVTGQPHPAAVRQVLRESAVELGLVERADGRFEPVADGPLDVAFDGVAAFPDSCGRVLDERLVERYGPDWPAGESGARIRERVRTVKAAYLRGDPVEYDAETALCYALYHLPDYYAAVQYVLAELVDAGLLDRDLRVLDVGAGVGGPALGLADFLPENALVGYHAVEPSEAADVLDRLLSETGRNVRATVHRTTAEAFDPRRDVEWFDADERFDLVVFANVLSELDDPAGVVEGYADALATDGTVVAIAPADRTTATGLRGVERTVENGLTVYAPTVRLWPGETPTDEGWSFDVKPDLAVPGFQRRLDESATEPDHEMGEFMNVDVQYAYSLLRPGDERRIAFTPDGGQWAKMAEMETHVTDRIDVAAVKLSHDLTDGDDANPLFKIGDGSEQTAHYAVLTKESALNRDLSTAGYGDLLLFENVLVLWNDDEGAYNLVVDGETIVDSAPAGG